MKNPINLLLLLFVAAALIQALPAISKDARHQQTESKKVIFLDQNCTAAPIAGSLYGERVFCVHSSGALINGIVMSGVRILPANGKVANTGHDLDKQLQKWGTASAFFIGSEWAKQLSEQAQTSIQVTIFSNQDVKVRTVPGDSKQCIYTLEKILKGLPDRPFSLRGSTIVFDLTVGVDSQIFPRSRAPALGALSYFDSAHQLHVVARESITGIFVKNVGIIHGNATSEEELAALAKKAENGL